jgi:hypothetical protein
VHILKEQNDLNNDLTLQLKLLEKQEQANPKTSSRKKIIKIRAGIAILISTSKNPCSFLLLLILSLQQN